MKQCDACGDDRIRVGRHHWYDNQGRCFRKRLCVSCNSILKSNGNHILPSWEKQLEILKISNVYQFHNEEVLEQKYELFLLRIKENPKECPDCKSRNWDKEKERK